MRQIEVTAMSSIAAELKKTAVDALKVPENEQKKLKRLFQKV